ncbi:multicopper oxidase family protein [Pacificibacter sp.]|jgi:FtsP/CotA-like multicopper oxidase with cupredoxin domain|nr:multicopper oxidase family protein [Amylibacter sp.]HCI07206.1 copper oxidase [Sulfitobacter sp.]
MHLTRRHFLMSSAGAVFACPSFAQTASKPQVLKASVADVQLLPEGYGQTSIWGYEGSTPGPEIRVVKGARVQRTLLNEVPDPTSVHWHGIRIDNAMDGVSGLTQAAVKTGDTFEYDFVAPDAGTFWYHAHNRSYEQVARGLSGPLIVEEPEAIDIDREEVLVLDDWLINPETSQIDSDFEAGGDKSHGGRIGNYITTNGKYNLTLSARKNERYRLRLINASNARILPLQLEGFDGWIVALDGMPLTTPKPVTETIVLAPAQRIDLIVDVTAEVGETAHVQRLDRSDVASQVAFDVKSSAATSKRGTPKPLTPNETPTVDLSSAKPFVLKMEGGAMSGLRSATLGGVKRSMGEIVEAGQFWAFNGAADGMDGPPLAELSQGEHARIMIKNETSFAHAMHLHGMHFNEVNPDGTLGLLRDTTLVERGEEREIAFVADNPGKWLFHCHMLAHAASGMTTRILVS